MSIISRNYHSRLSVVRDDEAIKTSAETEEIWAKIRISSVAKTLEIRRQFFPGFVVVLVCLGIDKSQGEFSCLAKKRGVGKKKTRKKKCWLMTGRAHGARWKTIFQKKQKRQTLNKRIMSLYNIVTSLLSHTLFHEESVLKMTDISNNSQRWLLSVNRKLLLFRCVRIRLFLVSIVSIQPHLGKDGRE